MTSPVKVIRTGLRLGPLTELRAWEIATATLGYKFELVGPDVNGDWAASNGLHAIVIYGDGTTDTIPVSPWPPDPGEYTDAA